MTDAVNPYAPPKAALDDAPQPQIELATRAARFGAAIVDGLVLGAAAGFGAVISPMAIAVFVLLIGAVNLWTLHQHRASIGKLALKLRIVRADGTEAELWRIVLLRWMPMAAISAIPFVSILALVDVLFIFGAARRCVHDYIADTVVVDAK